MGDEPEDYEEKVKSEERAQSRIKLLVAKLSEDEGGKDGPEMLL
jgi:hypothetical protein